MENCLDLGVKVTFLLKIIDQVALPFIDQIAVNGALLIDRNQLLFAPAGDERNYREPGAIHAHHNDRPGLDVDGKVSAVVFRMILRRHHLHDARQAVFSREVFLQQARSRLDSRRRIGSSSF